MTTPDNDDGGLKFEGTMLLFDRPELLTPEDHGELGLSAVERPFEFVRQLKAVPLATTEIASAQKHMPVVFSNLDDPMLLAVLGIDDTNLFVDEAGRWLPERYVPAYIRAHPFALASNPGGDSAVVIDTVAAGVVENAERPFFVDGELTPEARARVDFCSRVRDDLLKTVQFCKRLKELDLLTQQLVSITTEAGTQEDLAGFVAVDVERLNALDKDALFSLHEQAWLHGVFGHLFSQENWNVLLGRRQQKSST